MREIPYAGDADGKHQTTGLGFQPRDQLVMDAKRFEPA
jgi:hypothetical protein